LITDPWFWLVAVIAVLLTGISKGGLGGGVGGFERAVDRGQGHPGRRG